VKLKKRVGLSLLKRRVWLIFALLAAVYLVLNTGWKHYGRNERAIYSSESDLSGGCEVPYDLDYNLKHADAVVQARVISSVQVEPLIWRPSESVSTFTIWVEDVWFGKCPERSLVIHVYGISTPDTAPVIGDRMVLFIEKDGTWYVPPSRSHGMYVLNPPTGLLHSLSWQREFAVYDNKTPGTLKRDLRRILREKAADWPEKVTGDVVKKYLWWR